MFQDCVVSPDAVRRIALSPGISKNGGDDGGSSTSCTVPNEVAPCALGAGELKIGGPRVAVGLSVRISAKGFGYDELSFAISDAGCKVPPETSVALLPLNGTAEIAAPVVPELRNAPAKEIVLLEPVGFVIAKNTFAVRTPGTFPMLKM